MKKHFIIDLVMAGAIASVLLVGCGKKTSQYCTVGMNKIEACDYQGAIQEFTGEINKNSGNRDAYRGLGIAYYRMGDYVSAAAQFKTVIDKSGSKYDDICLDAMKYYAECLVKCGDNETAVKYYTTLIDKCPKAERADYYFLRGCVYIKLKDENKAALDYEKAIDSGADDYVAFCNMYNEFSKAGYKDRAESYLKRVINDDGADDFIIGKTYYIFGNYEQAEKKLKAAVDSGKSDAIYYLAMTYEAEGKFVEAEDLYQTYMGKHSDDANIYNQYASYLMNRQNYKNALVYIEEGLKFADGNAKKALLYNQAICYEYLGDYDKAYTLLESYIGKYSNDSTAEREYIFLKSRVNS